MDFRSFRGCGGWVGLAMAAMFAGCAPEAPEPAGPPFVSLSAPYHSRAWSTPYGRGQELLTRHYRIYTTVRDAELLAILPGFMEAAHRNYLHICRQPNGDGAEVMPMYLLATRTEWEALTVKRFGRRGPAGVIEDGGYTYKGVTVCWEIGRTATLSVASHEGMHQYLYHTLRDRLPLWAEEGLATTAEGFVLDRGRIRFTPDHNLMRLSDLRTAILSGHWRKLSALLTTNTLAVARGGSVEKTVGYYGQLYALMRFLRENERYAPKWQAMFDDARTGRLRERLSPPQQARHRLRYDPDIAMRLFRQYVTEDLEGFEREFYAYARTFVKLQP